MQAAARFGSSRSLAWSKRILQVSTPRTALSRLRGLVVLIRATLAISSLFDLLSCVPKLKESDVVTSRFFAHDMASTLTATQPPANQEYAGDEINALILDTGSHTTRAGFAGEDTPKSVVPTYYGVLPSGEKVFGENAIHLPRTDMEIKNPFDKDGLVEDWETASKLWEYSVTSRLIGAAQTLPSKNGLNNDKDVNGDVNMDEQAEQLEEQEKVLGEYPLLMSEPGWNPQKSREKMMEIAMEEWGVPAFFLAKTGQLASYSQGKATALVVDIGHHNTSVTALWEGMVLNKSESSLHLHDDPLSFTTVHIATALMRMPLKGHHIDTAHSGVQHTPLAGNWLNDQIRIMLGSLQPPASLVPHYMVKSKQPVDAGAPSNAAYVAFTKPPSASFRRLEEERVLTAFKESIVQAWPGPGRLDSPAAGGFTNMDHVKQYPPKPFEMPDGWNQVYSAERFKTAEGLFDHNAAYTDSEHPAPNGDQTITSTASRALQACDVDARPHLMNNIVITGAGSLIEKLPERLQADLATIYPNPKIRVIANTNSVERKYGSWIGGSVLGSLGTFHQMWVSRQEYEEFGSKIVEKRCK